MKKSLFDHSLSFVFRHIKDTEIMAQNMRSPKHFIFGYIAKRIMLFGNQKILVQKIEARQMDKHYDHLAQIHDIKFDFSLVLVAYSIFIYNV